jgi:hypothetical protein
MRRVIQIAAGLGVVAAVIALALGVRLYTPPEIRRVLDGTELQVSVAGAAEPAKTPVAARRERLAGLPCFRCHEMEEFEKGEAFSHKRHAKELGTHCHLCHAFKGHFEVVTRKDLCAECHEDD